MRLSSPTLLFMQGDLEQIAQNHIQVGFEYLHKWKFHNLSGQNALVFDHPHSRKLFLAFK